jgi:signal transduction histidine kinase
VNWRPLDRVPSIKLKLGSVIVAAVAVSAVVSTIGLRLGIPLYLRPVIAIVLSLGMVQLLARGMTSPLREMAAASREMARGDYSRRVTASSQDEVGDLARSFNAMAAELEGLDRLRRDLVANVSHELRTPLTALRAVLENLVDGVAPADPETLRTMLAQTERLGRLVDQLLDLSRLESGVEFLDRRHFDLCQVVREAVDEVALHAPLVTIQISPAEPVLGAEGDPERIHQVVRNLLENALRFSPEGGTVAVRTARSSERSVRLEVADEGPGIPPEQASKVFERFYRADEARSSAAGGAGLGLAIARWIVDLHGGRIWVEGDRPGCRMVVELPSAAA